MLIITFKNYKIYIFLITGNAILIYIIASNKKMLNGTNLFIASMAATDLIMVSISLPLKVGFHCVFCFLIFI